VEIFSEPHHHKLNLIDDIYLLSFVVVGMEAHLMLNERALESCPWLVLERTPGFHQCFSRTNGLVVKSGKTHPDHKTVLHKNSRTTNAAKGNDFSLAVVPVKSRTSAKWQEYSKVPRVFHAPPWSFPSQRIL